MNKILLIGRITKDPELRYTTNANRAVTQITVAVNRTFQNQNGEREADFISVVVWDKQAENIKKYLSKGSLIAVEGRLQTRSYDNNEGKKVYVTEVVSNNVQFLESKNQSQNQNRDNSFVDANPFDVGDAPSKDIETVDIDKDVFADFGNSVEIKDSELPF